MLERRPVAGGRASSHEDEEGWIDNCQHVLLGCCTNLDRFYRLVGCRDRIRFYDTLLFLDRPGRYTRIRAGRLPEPFHLAPSFLRLPGLSPSRRWRLARALHRLLRTPPPESTFADWLQGQGQDPQSRRLFWDPIVVSALNAHSEEVACSYAFHLFREAFLHNRQGYVLGIPCVPLAELYSGCTGAYLASHNGRLRVGESVRELLVREDRVAGVVSSGGEYRSDYVISALPPRRLSRILPALWQDRDWARKLRRFRYSPILSAHFWLETPVLDQPFVTVLGKKIQWIFNRSLLLVPPEGPRQHLEAVISAASEWMEAPQGEVISVLWKELRDLFPRLNDADLLRTRVIREMEATFIPDADSRSCRPQPDEVEPNLFVCGDWTDTGWPATMEGAALSGFRCAESILRREGREGSWVAPPLRPAGLCSWRRKEFGCGSFRTK